MVRRTTEFNLQPPRRTALGDKIRAATDAAAAGPRAYAEVSATRPRPSAGDTSSTILKSLKLFGDRNWWSPTRWHVLFVPPAPALARIGQRGKPCLTA